MYTVGKLNKQNEYCTIIKNAGQKVKWNNLADLMGCLTKHLQYKLYRKLDFKYLGKNRPVIIYKASFL